MASAVAANMSVKLTAKTGQFAAQMNRAVGPLNNIQNSVRGIRRGLRIVVGGAAVYGLVRGMQAAVRRAQEFRVLVGTDTARRIQRLTQSYQALGHVFARAVLRVFAMLAPHLENLIDKLTSAAMWIERRITPANLRLAGTVLKVAAALVVAAQVMKLVVALQAIWNVRLKVTVTLQAALAALTGNWLALAAGAAAFGGTILVVNKAFGKLERDASGGLRTVGDRVDELKDKMLGLKGVVVGRLGVDFARRSQFGPNTELGRILDEQSPAAQAARETRRMREAMERDRAERKRARYGIPPGGAQSRI